MEKNLKDKLEQGYKRLCIVNVIWSSILIPIVFLVSQNYLSLFVIVWLIWFLIGLFLSPKITMRICLK
jgi:hypothetical protein